MIRFFCLCMLLFSALACTRKPRNMKEFAEYISDKKNGLSKEKQVSDVKIAVKYLPPAYLAMRETETGGESESRLLDSLRSLYKGSVAFLITVAPAINTPGNDIMYRGVGNSQEYKQRAYLMNFRINEYISLRSSTGTVYPVVHNMENTYSLENDRKIYVVFSREDYEGLLKSDTEMDLVFDDAIFETGINHFVFSKTDIDKASSI